MLVVACARTPEPEPVAAVVSPAEQACADAAVVASGADPATVSVVPVASTKTGATVYDVTVGETRYSCVVELDLTVSGFAPA